MVEFLLHPATLLEATHLLIVLAITVRVIMRRPATGVAMAWLAFVALVPFIGAGIYLLVGERRIGAQRTRRIGELQSVRKEIIEAVAQAGLTEVDWSRHGPDPEAMNELGLRTIGLPTVRGSRLRLISDTQAMLREITRDIDAATRCVFMEFYIWHAGGAADNVLEALIRAAERGVFCCVLIDCLGARPWWKGGQPRRLRNAGVHLRPALPVGILRTFVGRTDLRLHRKIVVVDGRVAWTGSMNLVDPGFFKQDSGVGEWIDAMVRLEGSVVVPLTAIVIADWVLETGESFAELVERGGLSLVKPDGSADIQVIRSGPGQTGDGLLQMLLALINSAREELILTTPYLVPDETLLMALRGAAGRGVKVQLILPERVDSFLARHACRSYYDELLELGVEVLLYRGGLLHTKSIMVDGARSMFGTVNLDMRSLWLNYEVALFIYDARFAAELRALQQTYIKDADRLDAAVWATRPFHARFLQNTIRLMSPLL